LIFLECYENELEQTKQLTLDIMENRDYVTRLTSNINDIEKKYETLSNDHQQYKIDSDNTICALRSKLNASEEIVKKLLPGNLFLFIITKFPKIKNLFSWILLNLQSLKNA